MSVAGCRETLGDRIRWPPARGATQGRRRGRATATCYGESLSEMARQALIDRSRHGSARPCAPPRAQRSPAPGTRSESRPGSRRVVHPPPGSRTASGPRHECHGRLGSRPGTSGERSMASVGDMTARYRGWRAGGLLALPPRSRVMHADWSSWRSTIPAARSSWERSCCLARESSEPICRLPTTRCSSILPGPTW